ncbi:MAG: HAD hydrolase family protein [Candidatus Omnitrophica bacterium]|nr:HAD hydrolase family protein [Candidatus Omnitrophota bacterium]
MESLEIFSHIKLLVCDFDGVFTDNNVIVDENGKESVVCSRADGMGVELLKKNGINVIVISKERNSVVETRCEKMRIPNFYGVDEKLAVLQQEMAKDSLQPDEVCYIGNDVNDIECMKYVVGVAVGDAFHQVKEVAGFVTEKNGGKGAVRELADLLLRAKQV